MKDTLVLDAGGVKGLYILGALKYLQENESAGMAQIKRYIGSSVGGVICFLLCIGLSPTQIIDIVIENNFKKLMLDPWYKIPVNLLKYGLHSGDGLINKLKQIIKQQNFSTDLTFIQLYDKTGKILVLTGTSVSSRQTIYFNYQNFPDMKILDALRITFAIPLFFASITTKILDRNHTLVDGGVLCSYPFYYLPITDSLGHMVHSLETQVIPTEINANNQLGIIILETGTKEPHLHYTQHDDVTSFQSYILSIINTATTQLEKQSIRNPYTCSLKDLWENSITISHNNSVEAITFDITQLQKIEMIEHGYQSAKKTKITLNLLS